MSKTSSSLHRHQVLESPLHVDKTHRELAGGDSSRIWGISNCVTIPVAEESASEQERVETSMSCFATSSREGVVVYNFSCKQVTPLEIVNVFKESLDYCSPIPSQLSLLPESFPGKFLIHCCDGNKGMVIRRWNNKRKEYGDNDASGFLRKELRDVHNSKRINCIRFSPTEPRRFASSGDDGNVTCFRFNEELTQVDREWSTGSSSSLSYSSSINTFVWLKNGFLAAPTSSSSLSVVDDEGTQLMEISSQSQFNSAFDSSVFTKSNNATDSRSLFLIVGLEGLVCCSLDKKTLKQLIQKEQAGQGEEKKQEEKEEEDDDLFGDGNIVKKNSVGSESLTTLFEISHKDAPSSSFAPENENENESENTVAVGGGGDDEVFREYSGAQNLFSCALASDSLLCVTGKTKSLCYVLRHQNHRSLGLSLKPCLVAELKTEEANNIVVHGARTVTVDDEGLVKVWRADFAFVARRPVFLILQKGKGKMADLLSSHWSPMYLTCLYLPF